jgi:hypothetical protein
VPYQEAMKTLMAANFLASKSSRSFAEIIGFPLIQPLAAPENSLAALENFETLFHEAWC